ncbi:hypothetical protein [Lysobacter auxotrophicus]|uniref:Tail fiber protein n=1 Tax=Lysobacter auxotrophicus TaxID=2992573 RepID=A0ABM8DFZ2_9GAMM|nr:hypothetical protein [Lysobacter auxotrophicus]BDU17515.1 hypothetical protein LA521A_27160 [Lysobacter auxotrophicus]
MTNFLIPNKNLIVPKRDAAIGFQHDVEQIIKMVCHKVDAHGQIVHSRVAAQFPNLITTGGLDRIGNNNGAAAYCQVGTGTAAPSFGDNSLANRIAGSNTEISGGTTQQIVAGPPRYSSNVSGRRFAAGVATGTLAEVGFGWATNGSLWNRALIRDGAGNPTTITVLSDEILDVYLETRIYIPTGDSAPFVLNLAGVDYTFVRRPMRNGQVNSPGGLSLGWGLTNAPGSMTQCGLNGDTGGGTGFQIGSAAWDGALAAENAANPTGNRSGANATMSAYVGGTNQRAGSLTWPVSQGNLAGGIDVVSVITNWSSWQFSVSPPIPKTSSQTLVLNVLQTWGRH